MVIDFLVVSVFCNDDYGSRYKGNWIVCLFIVLYLYFKFPNGRLLVDIVCTRQQCNHVENQIARLRQSMCDIYLCVNTEDK